MSFAFASLLCRRDASLWHPGDLSSDDKHMALLFFDSPRVSVARVSLPRLRYDGWWLNKWDVCRVPCGMCSIYLFWMCVPLLYIVAYVSLILSIGMWIYLYVALFLVWFRFSFLVASPSRVPSTIVRSITQPRRSHGASQTNGAGPRRPQTLMTSVDRTLISPPQNLTLTIHKDSSGYGMKVSYLVNNIKSSLKLFREGCEMFYIAIRLDFILSAISCNILF